MLLFVSEAIIVPFSADFHLQKKEHDKKLIIPPLLINYSLHKIGNGIGDIAA